MPGGDAAGDEIVELAGVEFFVGGALGDPEMPAIRAADQAVQMHADADDAETGQGAAVQHGQDRAVGGFAHVEILVRGRGCRRRRRAR